MTGTITPSALVEQLRQFTGSELFYRHPFNRQVVYTEGVRFLAEQAEAFWLIDAIASYFGTPRMRAAIAADGRLEDLQFWSLRVEPNGRACLVCQADSGEPAAIVQNVPFTDFPLARIDVWAGFNGEFWTLYLPSEH